MSSTYWLLAILLFLMLATISLSVFGYGLYLWYYGTLFMKFVVGIPSIVIGFLVSGVSILCIFNDNPNA